MEERNYFSLSPDEEIIFAWAGAAPAAMMNVALKIEIKSEINEELFLQALKTTVERLPYTRCRLHDMPDGTTQQYISGIEEQVFPELIDCTGWSESKIEHKISKWAGTGFSNNGRDIQLFHAELMRTDGGKHILYFCAHHIIMDIYALVYFITYLDKVYYALSTGTDLPREGSSPEQVTRSRIAYTQSEKHRQDGEWWKSAYPTEPQFTSINGLGGHEYVKGKRYGRNMSLLQMAAKEKDFQLPHELADAVQNYCTENRLSQSVMFVFALQGYLASVCRTNDVCVCLPIASRATLAEKSSGLNMATGFCFRGNISPDLSFAECLQELNKTNSAYMKHSRYPNSYGLLRDQYNTPQEFNYDCVMFSYVPFADDTGTHLKFRASELSSGVALWPVYILAMPMDGLKMVYRYSSGYVKEKSIDSCHAFLQHFLEAGLKDPEQKLETLLKESMDCAADA